MENSLYFITAYAILGQVLKIRIFFFIISVEFV